MRRSATAIGLVVGVALLVPVRGAGQSDADLLPGTWRGEFVDLGVPPTDTYEIMENSVELEIGPDGVRGPLRIKMQGPEELFPGLGEGWCGFSSVNVDLSPGEVRTVIDPESGTVTLDGTVTAGAGLTMGGPCPNGYPIQLAEATTLTLTIVPPDLERMEGTLGAIVTEDWEQEELSFTATRIPGEEPPATTTTAASTSPPPPIPPTTTIPDQEEAGSWRDSPGGYVSALGPSLQAIARRTWALGDSPILCKGSPVVCEPVSRSPFTTRCLAPSSPIVCLVNDMSWADSPSDFPSVRAAGPALGILMAAATDPATNRLDEAMAAVLAAYLAMLGEQDLEGRETSASGARLDALTNPAGVAMPPGQTEVMIP